MSERFDTEIVYGLSAIIERTLSRLSKANTRIDACISGAGVISIVKAKPIFDMTVALKNKGVKIRYITDITPQNLSYVKELMKTAEFRHMDEIKGNYSIVDGVDYQATAAVDEGEGPTESVLSVARAFVEQQIFVFDMLWKKAIPARQRIGEIEEGLKREFIETIQDELEIKKIMLELISSAVEQINIVLPTDNLFFESEKEYLLNLLIHQVSHGKDLSIKIIADQKPILKRSLEALSKQYPNLQHRFSYEKIQSQIIIITIDGEYTLAIESKEIGNFDYETIGVTQIGIAIYSNSKYTIMTYDSLFETLWTKSEIKEVKHDQNKRALQI
ncbi:MAG: hypothetical protein ACTHKK_07175 [Candidatus Nitrosocosmicus sp.]